MCEYCRCIGGRHDPQCPNYDEPDKPFYTLNIDPKDYHQIQTAATST